MNELAATILLVTEDDIVAFAIFSELVEKLEGKKNVFFYFLFFIFYFLFFIF